MAKIENRSWWHSPILMVLAVLVLWLGVIWQAVEIGNSIKRGRYIGKPTDIRDTITVTGEGKVTGIPDVAEVNVGLRTEKKTAAEAQQENTTKFNSLLKSVKSFGIKDEDIKTVDYHISPVYDYTPERGSMIRGYEVSQSVNVKIRNLDKIGDLLTAAGQGGANQVGGISFAIDDPESLRQQARIEALLQAQGKAQALANVAGVRLGKVVSFSENESGNYPYPVAAYMKDGMGGGAEAPSIQSGSLDVIINATVSYEIL